LEAVLPLGAARGAAGTSEAAWVGWKARGARTQGALTTGPAGRGGLECPEHGFHTQPERGC